MSDQTTLSRRERERSMRRQAMLDAARAVFAEKGYRQATLEEIAETAEFGKGTLYNYFDGGKEELLFAVLDNVYDTLCNLTDDILRPEQLQEQSIQELFRGYFSEIIGHLMEHRDLFMLLIKEGQRMAFDEEQEKVEYFQRQNQRLKEQLLPTIERGIARGCLKPFPPQIIASAILGNMNGYLMEVCCRDEKLGEAMDHPDAEQAAEFITTMLFDGLSTGSER
jgi:AcrR family transcriptional regulator